MPYRKQVPYSRRPNMAARRAHRESYDQFKQYDTRGIRPKRNNMNVGTLVAIIVVVIVLIVVIFNVISCSNSNNNLAPDGTEVSVVVNDGDSASAIGQTLVDDGLIRNSRDFTNAVSNANAQNSLKPGTYTIVAGTSIEDIVSQLEAGPVNLMVTVPEGATISQIAPAVEQASNGSITATDFTNAAHNAQAFADAYPFVADAYDNTLEGFLAPQTYPITSTDTADSLIRKMLDQYQQNISQLNFSYPQQHGLSNYQALALASVVERETNTDNRATVASVFYNRLAQDMPLQSDATVAYVVNHDPTPDDLQTDSPYNTYQNTGVPAGPICSPSIESLQAVCNPDQTDYLYFYFYPNSDGTMNYVFSRTYAEHQQAISQASQDSSSNDQNSSNDQSANNDQNAASSDSSDNGSSSDAQSSSGNQ